MPYPFYYKRGYPPLLVSILSILAAISIQFAYAETSPLEKLSDLGIELKSAPKSLANYRPAVRSENLVFLAGAIAKGPDGNFLKGKLGEDLSVEEGYQSARLATIGLLSALLAEIGDLEKVEQIVKIEGFVNCTADFEEQSLVINGCSDLLVEIFGDRGRHSRIAIGAQSLPFGAPVEISAIIRIKD